MKKLLLTLLGFLCVTLSASADNSVGFSEMQGHRKTMEDAHYSEINQDFAYFGLFDGHGGRQVADFAAQELHKHIDIATIKNLSDMLRHLHNAFITTHNNLDATVSNIWTQGCTALVACIYKNNLFVANAGDSRAVLSCAGLAIPLSIDHKPTRLSEKERIESLGGYIAVWGVPRVNGQLAVTRALGDKALNPLVIPDPEISMRTLTKDDEFLVVACDGVWDVIDNQAAVDIVKKSLAVDNNVDNAAQALRNAAFTKGSTDNISVIVIKLRKFRK